MTIQKVSFANAKWMKQNAIALNGGLVAIIGARGSGKTAFAEIVAMGADATDAGKGEASFLKRASIPVDFLGDAAVTLSWGDDTHIRRRMRPGPSVDELGTCSLSVTAFCRKLCSASGLRQNCDPLLSE